MSWVDFVTEEWLLCSLLSALVSAFLILEMRKGGSSVSYHLATRLINDGAVLVDIREAKEYKAGHIVNALHIPFTNLKDRVNELDKHKSNKVILVDKMGQQTGSAGKILRDQGFDVVRLQGGMMEWQQQNLPVVKA
jgi:rhodanese-related sulfurtransferase